MRSPLAVLATASVVCGAPLAVGGITLTAIAATLSGLPGSAPSARCVPVAVDARQGDALDTWMARVVPGSPLVGLGAVFVAVAAPAGLDPRILPAIALQETRLGTAGGGPAVRNPFGLGPGLAFASWRAAAHLAVVTLATMYSGGARTIAQIGTRWAPVGAANDPAGLNANWVSGVADAYASLGGDPTGPVFGRQQVQKPCIGVVAQTLARPAGSR
jgi:hypothetical protein